MARFFSSIKNLATFFTEKKSSHKEIMTSYDLRLTENDHNYKFMNCLSLIITRLNLGVFNSCK